MANPLAAFGQALGLPQQAQSNNISEAVLSDDPVAVARFLSQGSAVNAPNEVCSRSAAEALHLHHAASNYVLYCRCMCVCSCTRDG